MDYTTAIAIGVIAIVFGITVAVVGMVLSKKKLEKIASDNEFKDINSDFETDGEDENDFYPTPVPISNSNPSQNDTEKVTAETTEVPGYILEQQKALAYIEANEGIESDEGEHYYKLAMSYFTLQKACYRPLMIKNLEKYLNAKPYTEKYKDYAID